MKLLESAIAAACLAVVCFALWVVWTAALYALTHP